MKTETSLPKITFDLSNMKCDVKPNRKEYTVFESASEFL